MVFVGFDIWQTDSTPIFDVPSLEIWNGAIQLNFLAMANLAHLHVFAECAVSNSGIVCRIAVDISNQLVHLLEALESILEDIREL